MNELHDEPSNPIASALATVAAVAGFGVGAAVWIITIAEFLQRDELLFGFLSFLGAPVVVLSWLVSPTLGWLAVGAAVLLLFAGAVPKGGPEEIEVPELLKMLDSAERATFRSAGRR